MRGACVAAALANLDGNQGSTSLSVGAYCCGPFQISISQTFAFQHIYLHVRLLTIVFPSFILIHMERPASLAELLRPYASAYIAEKLDVTRGTATAYKAGRIFPPGKRYEALALMLRVDVAEIVRLATRFHDTRECAGT
jgi:hypothetical protein